MLKTTLSSADIKKIRSLKLKKFRTQYNQFVVEGEKLVEELVAANYANYILYSTKKLHSFKNVPFVEISEKQLSQVSQLKSPNTCLAVVDVPNLEKNIDFNNWVFCLNLANDPGNLGTIIRTIHWLGGKQLVVGINSVDIFNSKTLQSSMGSVFHIEIIYENIESVVKKAGALPIYGADMQGTNLSDWAPPKKGVIVFGSESHGISTTIKNHIEEYVCINKIGTAESLNLSVAFGIIAHKICLNL